ncbi:hypothetical protein [Nocardia amamiensis]|uniref:hypothetical protein n=1 Tax=Nocardia amamiensis TaxID=404578 RepID=UPI000834979A|nr:hypothetical protein [Nocardia amamiensis]
MGERSIRRRVWEEFVEKSRVHETVEAIAPGDKLFRDSVIDDARILVAQKDRAALEDPAHVGGMRSNSVCGW